MSKIPVAVEYETAVKALQKFCDEQAGLTAYILADEYPIRVRFIPDRQYSFFGNENFSEDGSINDLTVEIGLKTTVRSTLKFKMDSKLLKKLIKLAEKVGNLYYHAFREEQGERITPLRPYMKAEEGFDPEVASVLCCSACHHPVVNQWGRNTNPAFCQGCGQALDWTPLDEETEEEENASN
jgi:hypothetical protein